MERPLVGAHSVPGKHMFSVLRVSGIMMTFMAVFLGWFVVHYAHSLFDSPPWDPFVKFIGGERRLPGWILLIGGMLGVVGLVTRSRAVSLASCVICIGWCGWIASFLWYANFTGEPNLGSFFAVIAAFVFIFRFWLLVVVPEPGEEIGKGW